MVTAAPLYRRAQPADVTAIVQLVHSAYRGDSSRLGWTTEADLLDGQRTDPAEVSELVVATDKRLILSELSGELVGCVLVKHEPPAVAQIGMFAVRPTLQGRGLGKGLLAEAERAAREDFQASRAEMTVIEQRPDILVWYERLGYQRTGTSEPFPYGNPRFGLPRRPDLRFLVLAKPLT